MRGFAPCVTAGRGPGCAIRSYIVVSAQLANMDAFAEELRAIERQTTEAAVADRARAAALSAMVERCETGFEAWEVFASNGVIPVEWLSEERWAFATQAQVLSRLRREHLWFEEAIRVRVHSGVRALATRTPADKPLAIAMACRARDLDVAERLARRAIDLCAQFEATAHDQSSRLRSLWTRAAINNATCHVVERTTRAITQPMWLFRAATRIERVDPSTARTLIDRVRALWSIINRDRSWRERTFHRLLSEEWNSVLTLLAPIAATDGSITVVIDLAGLDGQREVRIERHQRVNPYEPLAALSELRFKIASEGNGWLYLAVD
jgi:hypothetical protein